MSPRAWVQPIGPRHRQPAEDSKTSFSGFFKFVLVEKGSTLFKPRKPPQKSDSTESVPSRCTRV